MLNWGNADKKGTVEQVLLELVKFHENNDLRSGKIANSHVATDIDGRQMIGYGSTYHKDMKVPMPEADAAKLLINDLKKTDNYIKENKIFNDDAMSKMTDQQYGAIVSLFHNVSSDRGRKNLSASTLVQKINASGDQADVAKAFNDELTKWNKAGGKVSKGILKRRVNESRFASHTGDFDKFQSLDVDSNEIQGAYRIAIDQQGAAKTKVAKAEGKAEGKAEPTPRHHTRLASHHRRSRHHRSALVVNADAAHDYAPKPHKARKRADTGHAHVSSKQRAASMQGPNT